MEWILPEAADPGHCRALAEALGLPPFLAGLLCRRGFHEAAAAEAFLDPKLKTLSDPFLLPGMEAAVACLLAAIDRGARIVLYGDYDVDGVTSLAFFTRFLRQYGARVECFLPSRVDEGYGLSAEGVARCVETHRPQLLIAVDCGTSSAREIAELTRAGVEVIVLDHHLPKCELPLCTALVNPKLGDEGHSLCSAGIVFKVAHALLKRRPLAVCDLREYLDLVALGTVADLVPLEGENRILVKRGLAQLERSRWTGVRALIEVAGVKSPFSAGDIGFKFGPRLNAAGRLGTAQDALELLLTEDPARARTLARALDAQNRERRAVEEQVLLEAQALVEARLAECTAAIVTGSPGWHPGVIGIVASRLMRQYHRPTLVVAFDENGLGKGSGRSIAGFSLVAALEACGHHLQKHGGHEMAAGLSVELERFDHFRAAFLAHARATLTDDHLRPRLHLEAELPLREISLALLERHEQLQPFGMGNPQPLFFARGVTFAAEPRVLKEKHLALRLQQGRHQARAIWFGGVEGNPPPPPWDIAFRIERNEYLGNVEVQIQIKAVRAA